MRIVKGHIKTNPRGTNKENMGVGNSFTGNDGTAASESMINSLRNNSGQGLIKKTEHSLPMPSKTLKPIIFNDSMMNSVINVLNLDSD